MTVARPPGRDVPASPVDDRRPLRLSSRRTAGAIAAGRPRRAAPQPAAGRRLPAVPRPSGWSLRRYTVVYVTDGPRIRLGIAWALLLVAALAVPAVRGAALATVFAVASGLAAHEVVGAWEDGSRRFHRWTAAAGAAAMPLASAAGVRGTAIALLGLVTVAVALSAVGRRGAMSTIAVAGRIVQSGILPGLAGAAVVLALRYEIGAVVSLLVVVAAYEASDYLVGSGAAHPLEGPLAGIISIAAVTAVIAALRLPPFHGGNAWLFGALAAVCCPLGQFTGSALLPAPDAPAPALRRIDSLLVLAPLWTWLVGLLIART